MVAVVAVLRLVVINGSCVRVAAMVLRNHRIPLQLLHELVAVLRVHELVNALMTYVRLGARRQLSKYSGF